MTTSILQAIEDYVEHGIDPGDFLKAVLSNELHQSFVQADFDNAQSLEDIINFIFHSIPSKCWGSRTKVKDWMNWKITGNLK